MPANKQSEHGAMIIALARAGRRVVRLVTARAEAEIAACRAAGVTVEVVPPVVIPPPQGEGGDARERGRRRVGQSRGKLSGISNQRACLLYYCYLIYR